MKKKKELIEKIWKFLKGKKSDAVNKPANAVNKPANAVTKTPTQKEIDAAMREYLGPGDPKLFNKGINIKNQKGIPLNEEEADVFNKVGAGLLDSSKSEVNTYRGINNDIKDVGDIQIGDIVGNKSHTFVSEKQDVAEEYIQNMPKPILDELKKTRIIHEFPKGVKNYLKIDKYGKPDESLFKQGKLFKVKDITKGRTKGKKKYDLGPGGRGVFTGRIDDKYAKDYTKIIYDFLSEADKAKLNKMSEEERNEIIKRILGAAGANLAKNAKDSNSTNTEEQRY